MKIWKKGKQRFCLLFLATVVLYGAGRLYYQITAGFTESNISYDLPKDSRWEIAALDEQEQKKIQTVLSQEFYYLGKGCQSYVFKSQDDKYVIKFFKYQRMRPQAWLPYLTFIPWVNDYYLKKIAQKKCVLDNAFSSWKLGYEELQPETGILFIHLNKTQKFDNDLIVYDKMGFKHELDLNNFEFMIQEKAELLCPAILEFKSKGDLEGAKLLVERLLQMILSEYQRGYADNDHALMQNTGVYNGFPIHIDVGRFAKNPIVKEVPTRNQELFSKTWRFRIWLHEEYPKLAEYVDERLHAIIGDSFFSLKPDLERASRERIPNQF